MNEGSPIPDVLTVTEIANYLRVSETTVWRWCSTGRLPAFRIGRGWRVQRSDLEQHIKSQKFKPSGDTVLASPDGQGALPDR